jgi:hypothetical protein
MNLARSSRPKKVNGRYGQVLIRLPFDTFVAAHRNIKAIFGLTPADFVKGTIAILADQALPADDGYAFDDPLDDPWAELISDFLADKQQAKIVEILRALDVSTGKANRYRLGFIMTALGWVKVRNPSLGRERSLYRKPVHGVKRRKF